MRKIADVLTPQNEILRVMIYENGGGVYLFFYDQRDDGPCSADYWFESITDAETVCVDNFGITVDEWKDIADPKPDCLHDWINPTRIKRDPDGNKHWGHFEPVTEAG